MAKRKARPQKQLPSRKGLPLVVKLWIAIALVASGVAGVLTQWPRWFPVAPERRIAIYRTHGCQCAFLWARQLEASGYVVTLYEPESLKTIRGALKTPPSLRGCHVGRYLEYFVEGHVSAEALGVLARQHPPGLGVGTESAVVRHEPPSSTQTGGNPGVTLYDQNGNAHHWWSELGA